ncbi:MAG: CheY-like chemotaxis protein [Polaribacter sp.]|jgi:CheY-like chemotaxis protein
MKKLSLLIIDDDEIERMKFKRVCEKWKYPLTILEAKNGEVALEILKNKDSLPHLILLDLNMPKMNGVEFLRILKLKESLKYIPIVIMSSSNYEKDVKECYKLGAAGYIIKPLHFVDYSNRIVSLLNYWTNNELAIED